MEVRDLGVSIVNVGGVQWIQIVGLFGATNTQAFTTMNPTNEWLL